MRITYAIGRSMLCAAALACAAPAAAQIVPSSLTATMYNVRLGPDLRDFYRSTELDSVNGQTNPLFTVVLGSQMLFGVSISSAVDDFLTATWTGAGDWYTLQNPNVNGSVTYVRSVKGGINFTELLTFTKLGEYTGTINLNLQASNPDYRYSQATNPMEAPTFSFRVNVVNELPAEPEVPAVPEPATWAMMLLGFGLVARMVRSRGRGRSFRRVFA